MERRFKETFIDESVIFSIYAKICGDLWWMKCGVFPSKCVILTLQRLYWWKLFEKKFTYLNTGLRFPYNPPDIHTGIPRCCWSLLCTLSCSHMVRQHKDLSSYRTWLLKKMGELFCAHYTLTLVSPRNNQHALFWVLFLFLHNLTQSEFDICLTSLTRAKPKEKMEFPA